MEELYKIFGKYFPAEFSNYEINKKEMKVDNKDIDLEFEENKINTFKINLKGESKINLNLFKQKNYLIHLLILLDENSNLTLNIRGKIFSKVLLALEIIGNKNSKAKISEKIIVNGEYTSISKLTVPENAIDSDLLLDQYYMIVEGGKIVNLPILNVNRKECKVKHSSKKIKLNEDQIFYLETKGFSKENIINLLEKSFFEI